MVQQKINYGIIFLLCFFLFIIAKGYAQDSRSLHLSAYGRAGVVYKIPDEGLGGDFGGGLSIIIPIKNDIKKRFEIQAQYDAYFFMLNHYSFEDNKWRHQFKRTEYEINLNFLFHFPVVYKENYKLFIAPGQNLGLSIRKNGGNPWVGVIVSVKQVFKLTNSLHLFLDVNSLNQIFGFSIFGGSFTAFNLLGAINIGLYW